MNGYKAVVLFLLQASTMWVLFLAFAAPLLNSPTNSVPIETTEPYDTEPNPRVGDLVKQWNDTWNVNPEELGTYFEGDIVASGAQLRSIANNLTLRWPNGIIPYEIVGPYNDKGLQILQWAFNEYKNRTCIRFVERSPEHRDYLIIYNNDTGCWSSLGRQGGRQEVNLQYPGCLSERRKGTAIHELMHALGVKHEHTRIDRDDYITVLMENVVENRTLNFDKSEANEVTNYGVPYDFGSVMHYSMYAFSVDNFKSPTIRPKVTDKLLELNPTSFRMGQREGFGENDVLKLNRMYCSDLEKEKHDQGDTPGWARPLIERIKAFVPEDQQ